MASIAETIRRISSTEDWSLLSPQDKNILYAYYYGVSQGVRRVCDKHRAILSAMRLRADTVRYSHMAHTVIGKRQGNQYDDMIYDPDYDNNFGGFDAQE